MDLNKKLIDQLSDLSRNIKSLTSEVKGSNSVSPEKNKKDSKEESKDSGKNQSIEEQNKNFLKSLEDIFKKGIGEITKSNSETKGILKDSLVSKASSLPIKGIQDITSNLKIPKDVSGLLGKLPKFADGGTMKKDGLAVVGEKGPEVVKLDKGAKVISNQKSKNRDEIEAELLAMELEDRDREMDKFRKDTKDNPDSSTMKTADQTLSPPAKIKLTENSTIEEVKAKLMQEDPDWYSNHPEDLEEDAEYEFDNLKQNYGTFTREDIQKLSQPVKPTAGEIITPEEISKKEARKKEKEAKKKEKEDKKKAEALIKSQIPKTKEEEKEEKSSLKDKGKNFLKDKGALDKGKNLLLSQGKDILSGKNPMDLLKNPSSLLGDKNQLLAKGIGSATSLLSNKGLREKGLEKLKGLKKEKGEIEEKSSISIESPELKKPKAEVKPQEEIKTSETPKETKKEIKPKAEEPKEEKKQETTSSSIAKKETSKSSDNSESSQMGSQDMSDIKVLLGKIASLLEGPLSIETMDSPFRPDSRRF